MYSAIGAAVAAQHVKDMLDQAAQDQRTAAVRRVRRARSASPANVGELGADRRARRHDRPVLTSFLC